MADQQFFEKKVRTMFTRFDADSNGTIEDTDFDQWADKLIKLGLIFIFIRISAYFINLIIIRLKL
jgi:hypothetical protein